MGKIAASRSRRTPDKEPHRPGLCSPLPKEGIFRSMDIRLLLVSKENPFKEKYVTSLRKLGAQVDTVSTFKEMMDRMADMAYSGVAIDLTTKIREPRRDKEIAEKVLAEFPVAQLNFNHSTRQISTLYFGKLVGTGSLEDFISQECRAFSPKKIHEYDRGRIHLNIQLTKKRLASRSATERTVTMDISRGGCFVISSKAWKVLDEAWIVIKELSDQTPIRCQVRWKIPWGDTLRIPGIGMKFMEITAPQIEEIVRKAGLKGIEGR